MNFKCDLFHNNSLNSVFLLLHQNSNPRKIYTLRYIKYVPKSLKNLPQCLPRLPLSSIPRRKFTYPLFGLPLPKISNFLPLPLINKPKHHCCSLPKKTHSLILFGTNYSKNGPSENCGREPLKNLKWYGLFKQTISLQIFQGSLPQISLGPFLNIFPHLDWEKYLAILHLAIMRTLYKASDLTQVTIYLFKVNKRNIRLKRQIQSKLTTATSDWHIFEVFKKQNTEKKVYNAWNCSVGL